MTVGDKSAIEVVLWVARRKCWGDLYLTGDTLYFVCFADQGPLGKATPALFERAQVRKQLMGTPVEQAVTLQEHSRRFAIADIKEFKKAFWSGQTFTAGGTTYRFEQGLGAKEREKVRSWCSEHQIACSGF